MKKTSTVGAALSKAFKGFELFSTGVVDLIDEVAGTNRAFNIRDHEMYPFTDEFTVCPMGATTRLKYHLGDVDASELNLKHSDTGVSLNIHAFSKGFLIENLDVYLQDVKPELRKDHAQKLAHLRWNTCTADDLNLWVKSWLVNLADGTGGCEMWAGRAMIMVRHLHSALIELREKGELLLNANSYRKALPLDAYMALSENEKVSERVRNLLKTYLVELPGFHEDDALSGSLSPKAYEHHGYLTMQVVSLVAGVGERGKVRSYRMGSTKIDYTSDRAIRQIKAFVAGEVLTVELVHAEPGFKTVEIQNLPAE